MTFKENAKKVANGAAEVGKQSLTGLGIIAKATLKLVGEAADIQRRDEIKKKLDTIDSWDLPLALEIIQERINNRS